MKYKLKKVGGEFEIEGTLKEIIQEASLIKSIPDKCPLCQGDVTFDYRKPKGFEYYSLKCTNCHAVKNFGQAQDEKKSLFLRWDTKFEKYQKTEAPQEATSAEQGTDGAPF